MAKKKKAPPRRLVTVNFAMWVNAGSVDNDEQEVVDEIHMSARILSMNLSVKNSPCTVVSHVSNLDTPAKQFENGECVKK